MENENNLPKKNILSAQIDLSKFEPATEEEKRQQDVMSKSTTFFRDGMRKLFKNPLALLSIVLLTIIVAVITLFSLKLLHLRKRSYLPDIKKLLSQILTLIFNLISQYFHNKLSCKL